MNMKKMRGIVDPISLGFIIGAILTAASATATKHHEQQVQQTQTQTSVVQTHKSTSNVLDLAGN